MRQANEPSRRLRFGVFEVDLRTGELTKRGVRVRLQQQPFQVLTSLVERPGELVTREELRDKLWGRTVVDFDHGLNKAINKIRDALGDSAENPRFVETVARRGYRFLADVTPMDGVVATSKPAETNALAPLSSPADREPTELGIRPKRATWIGSRSAAGICIGVAIAALLSWMLYSQFRPSTPIRWHRYRPHTSWRSRALSNEKQNRCAEDERRHRR